MMMHYFSNYMQHYGNDQTKQNMRQTKYVVTVDVLGRNIFVNINDPDLQISTAGFFYFILLMTCQSVGLFSHVA